MLHSIKPIAILILVLATSATASAQHHHLPNLEGTYTTYSPEICSITQYGNTIHLSSENSGTTMFRYSGSYGLTHYDNAYGVRQSRMGFIGKYTVTYFDGRPPVEGVVCLFPAPEPESWGVHFFNTAGQKFIETESRLITRTGPLDANPRQHVAANPPQSVSGTATMDRSTTVTPSSTIQPDRFNLLSADDFEDLGI